MTKVLVATEKPFAAIAVKGIREIIESAGFEFALLEKYPAKDDLIKAVSDADALIIRSDIVDKEVISGSTKLKIVVRAGAGYDNVDLVSATEKHVTVMNTPGQNSNAVAELGFGMMIYLNRNGYNGTSGTELRGKKLGLHAYGHIGKVMGHIARGMGMKVHAFDPFVDSIIMVNDGIESETDVKDLYRKCEYVAVNLPANQDTRNSINSDLLSLMPQGATLVNTARKEIIDENSLLKIFSARPDFRYITDVAPDCKEAIAAGYPGRYFWTPKKMGAQTAEANINAGLAAARQIVSFIKEGSTVYKVN